MEDRPIERVAVSRAPLGSGNPVIVIHYAVSVLAGRKRVMDALDRDLRQYLPSCPLDERMFKAVILKKQGLSYRKASIRIYGTGEMERRIRHWYCRLFGPNPLFRSDHHSSGSTQ